MNLNWIVGILAVVTVGMFGYLFIRPVQTIIQQLPGAVPSLNSPLEVNGTAEYRDSRAAFLVASSTLCSFKTPPATTTGQILVRVKTLPFAFGYQIAGSLTSNTGTTTNYGFVSDSSNSMGISSTTNTLFPPSSFINVVMATSAGTVVSAGFNPTGTCQEYLRGV